MVVFFGMLKKSMKCNLAGGYADGTRPIIHHVNAGMHIHLYLMWKRNRTIRASELLSIAIRCEIHIAFAWFKLIIVIYPHMTLDYWSWYLSWLYFTVLHSYPSLLVIHHFYPFFNGHFRNLNWNIPTKYGLYGTVMYSTSILGSWNSHWVYIPWIRTCL